jgi:hypothetical protein
VFGDGLHAEINFLSPFEAAEHALGPVLQRHDAGEDALWPVLQRHNAGEDDFGPFFYKIVQSNSTISRLNLADVDFDCQTFWIETSEIEHAVMVDF